MQKGKRIISLLLALAMLSSFLPMLPAAVSAEESVTISLWTYPIGGWVDADTVGALVAAF